MNFAGSSLSNAYFQRQSYADVFWVLP